MSQLSYGLILLCLWNRAYMSYNLRIGEFVKMYKWLTKNKACFKNLSICNKELDWINLYIVNPVFFWSRVLLQNKYSAAIYMDKLLAVSQWSVFV